MKVKLGHMHVLPLSFSCWKWLLHFIFLIHYFFSLSLSDPRISEAGLYCAESNKEQPNPIFIRSFASEMDTLKELVGQNNWGNHSSNSSTPPVYGLGQCHRDLPHTDCLLCFEYGCAVLSRCLPATSGRLYLDGCFLRYDSYSFFNESTDSSHDSLNCSSAVGKVGDGEAEKSEFEIRMGELVGNVTRDAVSSGGYGAMERNGVYGLAQCWKTVSSDGCKECLEKASGDLKKCVPSREGRALYAGCYLRYSTYNFFSHGPNDEDNNDSSTSPGVIVAIVLAAIVVFVFSTLAAYATYLRLSKLKQERNQLGQITNAFNKCSFNFKYETLEKATNYFDPSRKLGQGGAGSVFKGTLSNGQIVAVKRLFFNTRQWVDEFFNEVNLISGIQHQNLVKLLGCSIEGPESLLVYEYVPNKSLDQFLFAQKESQSLNWKQRFDIILGAAEGLLYLHEGNQFRIIHRDIKSSNVLLDENLAPKIADFGLVRCFGTDQTHLSTTIAGTLGYMAPEYIVQGKLTEKADVYSFGVLVLEIVCGRKNNTFIEDSGSLLQMVWKLFQTDRLVESVDSSLENDFPCEEATRVLQIGLLCTQASAASRPSMAEVVQMLTNKHDGGEEIPLPNQPPFLNVSSVLKPSGSAQSYSVDSLISNALTKIDVSSVYTGSSTSHSSDAPLKIEPLDDNAAAFSLAEKKHFVGTAID